MSSFIVFQSRFTFPGDSALEDCFPVSQRSDVAVPTRSLNDEIRRSRPRKGIQGG